MTITMSFVVAISLIFATAYAQQDNKPMGMDDKSHKYFAIQVFFEMVNYSYTV